MILVSIYINFTIFLKHPRTQIGCTCIFNAVFFYIILKLNGEDLNICYSLYIFTSISSSFFYNRLLISFSTIHFYIIFKRILTYSIRTSVSVPYIFTSFSNTSGYCNCRICVSVPYIFTSFSNSTYVLRRLGSVSVPYVFTSFSNLKFKNEPPSFAQNKVLKHI